MPYNPYWIVRRGYLSHPYYGHCSAHRKDSCHPYLSRTLYSSHHLQMLGIFCPPFSTATHQWGVSTYCLAYVLLCAIASILFMNKHFRRGIRGKYYITLAGTLFLTRIPSTSPRSSRGILYRHALHTCHESKFLYSPRYRMHH